MEPNKSINAPRPPRILDTIKAGFDIVSTHVYALLLPVGIDFFIWLGPHAHASEPFNQLLDALRETSQQMNMPADIANQSFAVWQEVLPRINFFAAIRTFPVGVPGLMWMRLPQDSPLGQVPVWDLTSWTDVFLLLIGITLLGWILGAIFLHITARLAQTMPLDEPRPPSLLFTLSNSLLLMVIWQGIAMLLGGSIALVSSLLFIVNPALGQTVALLALLAATWLIVPLFFSPHGIFVYGQNAIESLFNAFRFHRYGIHFASFFTFTLFMLAYLSGTIWNIPQENSWLLGVGIAGHAFVTTALFTASFIYYRNMTTWQQIVLTQLFRS